MCRSRRASPWWKSTRSGTSTHMDLSPTRAASRCRPQRRSSTKAASFCSWWQRCPRRGAKGMGKRWSDMPCRQPTKRLASVGPCCTLQMPGIPSTCVLDTSRLWSSWDACWGPELETSDGRATVVIDGQNVTDNNNNSMAPKPPFPWSQPT